MSCSLSSNTQAAEGDASAWRRQNDWLRRQLIAARRESRSAAKQRSGSGQQKGMGGEGGGGSLLQGAGLPSNSPQCQESEGNSNEEDLLVELAYQAALKVSQTQ